MVLFVPTSKRRGRGRAAWLQVMQGLLASKPAKIRITKIPSPEPVQPSACRSCSDYQLAFFSSQRPPRASTGLDFSSCFRYHKGLSCLNPLGEVLQFLTGFCKQLCLCVMEKDWQMVTAKSHPPGSVWGAAGMARPHCALQASQPKKIIK